MQFSVEDLGGLERRVTISLEADLVNEEMQSRFNELAKKVKVDGFRAGKVPRHVLEQRFMDGVKNEVAQKFIEKTLFKALDESKIQPATMPSIDNIEIEPGKEFKYSAWVEELPKINVIEPDNAEIQQIRSEIQEVDVDSMLEKMRKENTNWEPVTRPVAEGDKVVIDFQGSIDDQPFQGGEAQDFSLIIGSGSMIPGFEQGIVGAQLNQPFDIQVTFPEKYQAEHLSGKDAKFKITVKEILAGELPSLDDSFAEKYNIKEGGLQALREDIKSNMVRELKQRISHINRGQSFEKLKDLNSFDLPKSLIEQEIKNLKHQMFHRIFGNEHHDDEKIPDFPRSMFEKTATNQVHLSLLLAEYVKKHNISADKIRMDAALDNLSSAYEKPEEVRRWYMSNKEQIAQIEALVVEEIVAEKILENAKIIEKNLTYEEVMNFKADIEQSEGE